MQVDPVTLHRKSLPVPPSSLWDFAITSDRWEGGGQCNSAGDSMSEYYCADMCVFFTKGSKKQGLIFIVVFSLPLNTTTVTRAVK